MKLIPTLLCAITAAGLIAGCSKKDEAIPEAATSPTAPLPERIQAAAGMKNVENRDNTLRRIAMDAATQRNPDMAVEAISKLSKPEDRDDVAAGLARMFARMGNAEGAAKLIEAIADPAKKNAVTTELSGAPVR